MVSNLFKHLLFFKNMKTKTPISLLIGGFVVAALLAAGGFWMQISCANQTQSIDNQSVSHPNAAESLLRILPVMSPETTVVHP
jgi:hypothetical protein